VVGLCDLNAELAEELAAGAFPDAKAYTDYEEILATEQPDVVTVATPTDSHARLTIAAVPPNWPPVGVYFGITIVLATIGWTGLARVVRGKLLQLRAEEYVMAARLVGASETRIIASHMLPGMTSYLIVRLTLAIPGMILGETALSFLGLGLRPPVVSWGVLLQKAQNLQTLYSHPWILIPAIAVFVVVLSFNTFGDGLRDAADPYVR
jgi:peptide/nickel transport system permease protein